VGIFFKALSEWWYSDCHEHVPVARLMPIELLALFVYWRMAKFGSFNANVIGYLGYRSTNTSAFNGQFVLLKRRMPNTEKVLRFLSRWQHILGLGGKCRFYKRNNIL